MQSFTSYKSRHGEIDIPSDLIISDFFNIVFEAVQENKTIICAGNGGSSTTAEHFATDLSLLYKRIGKKCDVLSLTSNSGLLTAIGNDIDFEQIFSYQLEQYSDREVLLVGFSASGNSLNIVNAFTKAREMGFRTAAILGFDGGKLQLLGADCVVLFGDENKDYGIAENFHLMLCHYVIDELIKRFRTNSQLSLG